MVTDTIEGERLITIPLPDFDAILSPLHLLTYKNHEFSLDVGLFRALCIKNTTGDVSWKTLTHFAIGYALRRFTVHDRVISNMHIQYN